MANRHRHHDHRQSLGELLQQHRAGASLSLSDAIVALSISANTLVRIELGKLLPSRSLIEAMVTAYGLGVADRQTLLRLRFLALQANPAMPSIDDPAVSVAAKRLEDLVFLCHSSGDKERVRDLYRRLVADGVRCWFDEESLLPGQDWDYEIRKAIRESRYVLACISNASTTKTGYLQKELRFALDLADERPEGRAFIFPVRLEDCELPDRLKRWQRVDLFRDGGYERLLHGLGVVQASLPSRRRNPAISSHDFNVEVVAAVRRLWSDRFGEQVELIQDPGRSDGGVDCMMWPHGEMAKMIAVKTFPSPDFKLTAAAARRALDGVDVPCLMVTRLPLHAGTPGAVSKIHPYALRFMHWTGGDHIEDLEIALRILRSAAPNKVHDRDVLTYIRDVHNRISQLANAAIGDQLETIGTEANVDGTDFITILAPTQRLNAEFALNVCWEQEQNRLSRQVSTAKKWMREHGMWGVIVTRQYLAEEATWDLDPHGSERYIQHLLWRNEQDDEALELCLRRIAGSAA